MSLEATKEFNIDTVENAAATPKVELPWAELGLKDNEFAEIVKILDAVQPRRNWPCTR